MRIVYVDDYGSRPVTHRIWHYYIDLDAQELVCTSRAAYGVTHALKEVDTPFWEKVGAGDEFWDWAPEL
jgi:hypothetical protein